MAETNRFRSFAERYIIERASKFREGHEREDAWTALQDACAIYGMVAAHRDPDGTQSPLPKQHVVVQSGGQSGKTFTQVQRQSPFGKGGGV